MLNRPGYWKYWLIAGFIISIAFTWLNEIADLPHIIFKAPATPINWRESIIETVFSVIVGVVCWRLLDSYEAKWRETHLELEKLAITDELSGLLNRREFLIRAEKEFERAQRFDRPFSIAILDLDCFKKVNDYHGHVTGDRVIRELAAEINLQVRAQDLAGRVGGDEFMIVFVESTGTEARMIGRRIQREWQNVELPIGDRGNIKVTFSMGMTSMRKKDHSLVDCIQRADKALYAAKRKGRNKVVLI
ncbi:MAG: GGDEF domain-containing protein [Chloroflexi bacterium]|nr:GGDEF domain-containing protein [Chloroflexota bacterium]